MHFLYSGNYETINSPLDGDKFYVAREYRRNVLVYHTSRAYKIAPLEALAKKHIEHFGEEMSMFDSLRTIAEVFSKLPEDETWLPIYIKRNL